jgi:putative endonuclease
MDKRQGGDRVDAAGKGKGDRRKRLGAQGEQAAAAFLERSGFRIVARNWRSRLGELDVVAMDGDVLVFVEVKLRHEPFDGLEAVDARKQRKLSSLAFDFLLRHAMLGAPARFDVVAVEGRTLECTHVRDAFESTIGY